MTGPSRKMTRRTTAGRSGTARPTFRSGFRLRGTGGSVRFGAPGADSVGARGVLDKVVAFRVRRGFRRWVGPDWRRVAAPPRASSPSVVPSVRGDGVVLADHADDALVVRLGGLFRRLLTGHHGFHRDLDGVRDLRVVTRRRAEVRVFH